MNFKPILFSTPMVQAILNGTKLQTRRVVKGKALEWITTGMLPPDVLTRPDTFICPYGEVGDVLWVRESFYQYGFWRKNGLTKTGKQKWKFIADNAYTSIAYNDNPPSSIFKNSQRVLGWYKRSSLFMPKEACRLFLKIKDIRVERLQDISEEDAISEGVLKDVKLPVENFQTRLLYRDYKGDTSGCADARSSFMTLWKSINGEQSWNENPWVWVIEFERIEKPENF
jgi:hypothetical protein